MSEANLSAAYWRAISRIPVLPADEQLRLARRYVATRDPHLAERLVTCNLRLVVKIAAELARGHDVLDDLVQEGNAGLIRAVERFDPARGVKLTSYAAWWIRAYIMRYLMENARTVNVGKSRRGRKQFFAGTLSPPDVSLERDRGLPALCSSETERPDWRVEERDFQAKWRGLLARFQAGLDPRGKAIVRDRWMNETPARLTDVARRFSVTGERARQVERALMGDLRSLAQQELAA
jgi:RNA polymerase sigma-32 factor